MFRLHINDSFEQLEKSIPDEIFFPDTLGGFDVNLQNQYLLTLNNIAQKQNKVVKVYISYPVDNSIQKFYPNLKLTFESIEDFLKLFNQLHDYKIHPDVNIKNFVCSFNGTDHVGRQLLVVALNQFGYFNPAYCSKNFTITADQIDGHIVNYVHERDRFYQKFFINHNSDNFFENIYSFGHVRFNHAKNIHNLEDKLTQSFLHIVSESLATSYYPFVSEKFLYSVVTRGLFLSYAQPGWHNYLENHYGFKKYSKLFDYKFDTITNPVERLIELMSMISKFSRLSSDDWQDLYLLEQYTIEYNYDHYMSNNYLKYIYAINIDNIQTIL
jgi:hypothetical protein